MRDRHRWCHRGVEIRLLAIVTGSLMLHVSPITAQTGASVTESESSNRQSATTMDEILTAWLHREEQVSAARYTWTATETMTHLDGLDDQQSLLIDGEISKSRTYHVDIGTGPQIYFARTGQFWSLDERDFFTYCYSSAFDGEVGTSQFGDGYPDHKWGFVGLTFQDSETFETLPIILAHRPFEDTLTYNIANWEISPTVCEQDGVPCLAVQFLTRNLVRRVLVDPARDFIPIELQVTWKDQLLEQLTISFVDDPAIGWRVDSWRAIIYRESGNIASTVEATVETAAFNESVPPTDFLIEFTAGTVVQDGRDDTILVIRNDGSQDRYSEADWERGLVGADELNVLRRPE